MNSKARDKRVLRVSGVMVLAVLLLDGLALSRPRSILFPAVPQ